MGGRLMKKVINEHGHILMLSPSVGVDITDEEAETILVELANIPKNAPDGFTYRLRDDTHEWELYETPIVEDDELTEEETLDILLGGAV